MLPFSPINKVQKVRFLVERMSNGFTVVPLDPLKNKITKIKFIFNLCKNELTEKKKKKK